MTEIDNLKSIVENWYNRSNGDEIEFTIFDKFVSLWIAFNAWGIHITKKDIDRDMIEELKKREEVINVFRKLCKEPSFNIQLQVMKGVRIPKHGRARQPYAIFNDIEKFDDVLEVIYTIRCNLFHGYKNPQSSNEKDLVAWAFLILSPIFKESYKTIPLVEN